MTCPGGGQIRRENLAFHSSGTDFQASRPDSLQLGQKPSGMGTQILQPYLWINISIQALSEELDAGTNLSTALENFALSP